MEIIDPSENDLKLNMFRILKGIKKGKTAIKLQTIKMQSRGHLGGSMG